MGATEREELHIQKLHRAVPTDQVIKNKQTSKKINEKITTPLRDAGDTDGVKLSKRDRGLIPSPRSLPLLLGEASLRYAFAVCVEKKKELSSRASERKKKKC